MRWSSTTAPLRLRCRHCGHVDDEDNYRYGEYKGAPYFRHPEHRYCPACGGSIDWYGYERLREEQERGQ